MLFVNFIAADDDWTFICFFVGKFVRAQRTYAHGRRTHAHTSAARHTASSHQAAIAAERIDSRSDWSSLFRFLSHAHIGDVVVANDAFRLELEKQMLIVES